MFCKSISTLCTGCFALVSFLGTFVSHVCIAEELLAKLPAIRAGSPVAGISRERFVDRLTWLRELVRFNIFNFREKQTFSRLSQALELLKLDDSNGSIRKQPYCVFVTGHPGCGKSHFALQIATSCLRARYGLAKATDIVTLNETDEFQSEFRTNHKVVIFDDLGAESPENTTQNPWRKVIDFVNNVRKTSLNPNVEMKGNVYIEPDLVIITSNLKGQASTNNFLECPQAIWRRLKRVVYLESDRESLREFFSVSSSAINSRAYEHFYMEIDGNGTEPIPHTRDNFVKTTVDDFLLHMDEQTIFVRKTNEMLDMPIPRTIWQSFYSDVVEPYLPVVPILSRETLNSLSYFEYFLYTKVYVQKDIATCSADCLQPQSGREQFYQNVENFNRLSFLENFIDWDHFIYSSREIRNFSECNFEFFENGFRCSERNSSTQTFFKSFTPYTRDPKDYAFGVLASSKDVLGAYELHKKKALEMKDADLLQLPVGDFPVPEEVEIEPVDSNVFEDLSKSSSFPDEVPEVVKPGLDLSWLFTQIPPINFPLRDELLETIPEQIKICLCEWVYPSGVGDFVFAITCSGNVHYIVCEVKLSKDPRKQLFKAVQSFDETFRKQTNNYDSLIFSLPINQTYTFLPKYFSGKNDEVARHVVQAQFARWYLGFSALRCANLEK